MSKKLPKIGNLPISSIKKVRPNFLTSKTKVAFNHLWLAFTKAPILWYFDLKYHIQIKIDTSGYLIGIILSKLTS